MNIFDIFTDYDTSLYPQFANTFYLESALIGVCLADRGESQDLSVFQLHLN